MQRPARRKPKAWTLPQVVELKHTACGGATDGSWRVNVYTPISAGHQGIVLDPVSLRDLSGVLSTTSGRGVSCPPKVTSLNIPEVVELRPNVYHGGGLMPFKNRTAHYVVPDVFSATKWARRRLEAEETLLALDIPSDVIGFLRQGQKASLCNDQRFIPLKCALALVHALSSIVPIARTPIECTREIQELSVKEDQRENEQNEVVDLETAEQKRKAQAVKAVKADDAKVPEYLWDERVIQLPSRKVSLVGGSQTLNVLRTCLLRIWRRRITKGFHTWYREEHSRRRERPHIVWDCTTSTYAWKRNEEGLEKQQYVSALRRLRGASVVDWEAGRDCVKRCMNATWWDWAEGSRPLFWRWPRDYKVQIRDGLELWLKGPVARWRVPQRPEKDPMVFEAMRKKLHAVRSRGYIVKGPVVSLTSFFSVPKGDNDIRMVYDGTKSGLNAVLWAPWFPLPTVEDHLRAVTDGYFMGDIDVGEMFLNFMLHPRIRIYCGVDLSRYFPEEITFGQVLWEVWGRCGMGFTTSPYQAIQGILWAEEIILGDPSSSSNAFRWDHVELNLPGMKGYNPSLPWVAKVRISDGRIACDVFIYVDDVRVTGPTEQECWVASHQVASGLNELGLQDAARKRRSPSQEPGAWAGSIVCTTEDQLSVLISPERWIKTKRIIQWIKTQLDCEEGINFKELESNRGFLIYISRTYPASVPYLKGIHLTLDSWRPWRKDDGWKMSPKEVRAALADMTGEEDAFPDYVHSVKAPTLVRPVARLWNDVEALEALFAGEVPVRRRVRPSKTAVALYGFGDASGKGFGSTLVVGDCLHFRHGQWASSIEEESSNFRELYNLVLAIEDASEQGLLRDSELFMFTDNTTAEAGFYKGTSTSRLLFDLVLRLRLVQMQGEVSIHVVHVAGTRMKAEGTDGLSRGSLSEGVMGGAEILSYIPLHLSAPERSSQVTEWVKSWIDSPEFVWLTPEGWFREGHTQEQAIWTPAPAACEAALEQLGKAIHKRPQATHIFLSPRLLTARWRKRLGKICDVVVTLPVGTWFWDSSQHEPLILGIYLPLLPHRPWRFRGSLLVEHLEGLLPQVPTSDPHWGRDILREFLIEARRLGTLSECVVWRLLHGDRSGSVSHPGAGG